MLLDTTHNCFPVIVNSTFEGTISRSDLTLISMKMYEDHHSDLADIPGLVYRPIVTFPEALAMASEEGKTHGMREKLATLKAAASVLRVQIDLTECVNLSAVSVCHNHSLLRTYTLMRSQGLRHLVVVTSRNEVLGVVTRKDLMGFALEERLARKPLELVAL